MVNRTTTDDVTLTINSAPPEPGRRRTSTRPTQRQRAAGRGSRAQREDRSDRGHVRQSRPSTRTGLVSTDGNIEKLSWGLDNPSSDQSPLVSRTFQLGFLPGSTFKVVTSSAVFDHAPVGRQYQLPGRPPAASSCPRPRSRSATTTTSMCGGTIVSDACRSRATPPSPRWAWLSRPTSASRPKSFGFNQQMPIDHPGAAISTAPTPGPAGQQRAAAGLRGLRTGHQRRNRRRDTAPDVARRRRDRQRRRDHDPPRHGRRSATRRATRSPPTHRSPG